MKRCMGMILALAALCTACGQPAPGPKTADVQIQSPRLEAAATDEMAQSRAAYEGFAMEFFAQAVQGAGENPVLSPVSAYFALAMTANGAAGDTEAAFDKALGLTAEARNRVCLGLMESLARAGGGVELSIANSAWVNEGLAVQKPFLETLEQCYGAEMFQAQLGSEAAQKAMNRWVEEKTEGMIPRLFEKPLEGDSLVMVLVNALYLNAAWEYPLDANTFTGTFSLADGTATEAAYMSGGTQDLLYIQREGARGVVLPYKGGQLAFAAILPAEGESARDLAQSLAQAPLYEYLSAGVKKPVHVTLPKFSAEYGAASLRDALETMGLGPAFNADTAQFPNMVRAEEGVGPVYISDLLQKVRMDVNELGTEAAAVTAVVMEAGGASPDYEPLMFDRPFLYAVVDMETGLPLFMGLMERPA